MKKLKESGHLTSAEKVKLITHEFLMKEGFLHLSPNIYSLNGYEGAYVFEVTYINDENVFLKVSFFTWILINAFKYVRNEFSLVNF